MSWLLALLLRSRVTFYVLLKKRALSLFYFLVLVCFCFSVCCVRKMLSPPPSLTTAHSTFSCFETLRAAGQIPTQYYCHRRVSFRLRSDLMRISGPDTRLKANVFGLCETAEFFWEASLPWYRRLLSCSPRLPPNLMRIPGPDTRLMTNVSPLA